MNGILKAFYFLVVLAEAAIRSPHERRLRRTQVSDDRASGMERSLVGLLFVGVFFVPAVHALTPLLDGADYRLSPKAGDRAGGIGAAIMALAVWVLAFARRPRTQLVPVAPAEGGALSSQGACTGPFDTQRTGPGGSGA